MQIKLQTRYSDDTVQGERCLDVPDLNSALEWALASWEPAQGPRRVDGPGRYLNDRLLVSIDGGEFLPVGVAMVRAYTPVGMAA